MGHAGKNLKPWSISVRQLVLPPLGAGEDGTPSAVAHLLASASDDRRARRSQDICTIFSHLPWPRAPPAPRHPRPPGHPLVLRPPSSSRIRRPRGGGPGPRFCGRRRHASVGRVGAGRDRARGGPWWRRRPWEKAIGGGEAREGIGRAETREGIGWRRLGFSRVGGFHRCLLPR